VKDKLREKRNYSTVLIALLNFFHKLLLYLFLALVYPLLLSLVLNYGCGPDNSQLGQNSIYPSSLLPSTEDTIHLERENEHAQVVEALVTLTDNSPIQDYSHPDDHNYFANLLHNLSFWFQTIYYA